MAIKANSIHWQIVSAWNAFQAHPEFAPFMQPRVREQLKLQAEKVASLLVSSRRDTDDVDDRISAAEVTLRNTRELVQHTHQGLRFRYRNRPDQLAQVAPLRLGADPREDEIRLATLVREVPKLQPAFCWFPDEGFSHEALVEQLDRHRAAMSLLASLGPKRREALRLLREERSNSQRLWRNFVEPWIIATIPPPLYRAYGRPPVPRRRSSAQKVVGEKQAQKGEENKAGKDEAKERAIGSGAPVSSTVGPVETAVAKAPAPPLQGNSRSPDDRGEAA